MSTSGGGAQRTLHLTSPLDLVLTTAPLRHGPDDPSCRVIGGAVWRAWRSPAGPTTVRFTPVPSGIEVTAWGEGAEAALDAAPNVVGATDESGDFDPGPGPVRMLWDRFGGLRIPRTGAVTADLIAHVMKRDVTTFEAHRAHRQTAERWGDPAPGPTNLLLPPDPQRLSGASHYDLHLAGIDQEHADLIKRLAASSRRLDALALLPPADAHERLASVAGVGALTAALVATTALGDADAVPLGDVRVAALVTSTLTGHVRPDDESLLECLEPWRGHRARVIRLIEAAGATTHGPDHP